MGSVLLRRMSNHTKYVETATRMVTHDCSSVLLLLLGFLLEVCFMVFAFWAGSSLKEGLLQGGVMKKWHY